MVEALRTAFGGDVSWPSPRGGFFLWAALPQAIDADHMLPRAVDHGVIYVAGEAFFVGGARDGLGRSLVRLSFSAPAPQKIREGVRRFASAVREEQEAISPAAAEPGASPPPRESP
jgi:DNA-binding transcriptional MocR family regulator